MFNTSKIFDGYYDQIEYISKKGEKDMFGYSNSQPVQKKVRYVGGKSVEINEPNNFRIENRLLYQCPFEVQEGDKFKIDTKTYEVKFAEKIRDVVGRTIYWEAQII